jgi:hypothetical protein
MDGTCMREPALTIRTSTDPVPVAGARLLGDTGNSEAVALVLLKATPLIR